MHQLSCRHGGARAIRSRLCLLERSGLGRRRGRRGQDHRGLDIMLGFRAREACQLESAFEELVGRRGRQGEDLDVPALELGEAAGNEALEEGAYAVALLYVVGTVWMYLRPPAVLARALNK